MNKELEKALETEAHLNGLNEKEYQKLLKDINKLLDKAVADSVFMATDRNPAEW